MSSNKDAPKFQDFVRDSAAYRDEYYAKKDVLKDLDTASSKADALVKDTESTTKALEDKYSKGKK